MEDTELLDYYSKNFILEQLSSEDILKLTDNYIKIKIARAFHISIEEFDKIKKKKGITNIYLENSIRDIAVLLNYLDTKGKHISDEFRKEFCSSLIFGSFHSVPHRDFYIKSLSAMDFSQEQVKLLLVDKEIDIAYRSNKLSVPISIINQLMETDLAQSSDSYIQFNTDKTENEITINVDGANETYYVNYSDEKYSAISKKGNRKYRGAKHNYKLENEKKQKHGMIGEKIALEAEKNRLLEIGLGDLVEDVLLVSQINEETTFDGLGYDLLSFNENKERICIEVKTSYGKTDKPFFISKKELELMQEIKEEHGCKQILIQYLLIDGKNVTIKNIYPYDLDTLKLTPVLYKVDS